MLYSAQSQSVLNEKKDNLKVNSQFVLRLIFRLRLKDIVYLFNLHSGFLVSYIIRCNLQSGSRITDNIINSGVLLLNRRQYDSDQDRDWGPESLHQGGEGGHQLLAKLL